MKAVHIGLPKCASTSLQIGIATSRQLSSSASRATDIHNALHLWAMTDEFGIECNPVLTAFITNRMKEAREFVITNESLIGWNPATWRRRCGLLAEILPQDAKVLFMYRSPADYARSYYQQMVQENNIFTPREFFVVEGKAAHPGRRVCSLKDLNIQALRARLQDNFRNRLYCFDIDSSEPEEQISILSAWAGSADAGRHLAGALQRKRRLNRSYGSAAMRVAMARERWMNRVGLASWDSDAVVVKEAIKAVRAIAAGSNSHDRQISVQDNIAYECDRFMRAIREFQKTYRWFRWPMQHVIGGILRRPFSLDAETLRQLKTSSVE